MVAEEEEGHRQQELEERQEERREKLRCELPWRWQQQARPWRSM